MGNKTFAIIKPDAVKAGNTGKIYDRMIQAGFQIISAQLLKMSMEQAKDFYAVHEERPFFDDLIEFMTSGPCMVLALEKENAVESWRTTIGATNPEEADENTIRKDFAANVQENAVHGSDSDENAQKEIAFFFTDGELLSDQ
jgi:nucleoside-diphosphate kinase